MTKSEENAEAREWKLARLLQDYDAIKNLAKAPSLRRGLAGMIDLGIALSLFVFYSDGSRSWLPYALCFVYMLLRDSILAGTGIGKRIMGLRVYDYQSLEAASGRQILIRDAIYSTVCVFLVMVLGLFSIAAIAILPLGIVPILMLLSKTHFLAAIGYNPDDGRTIPDDWASTHVLTSKEVQLIRGYEARIEELR